MGPSPRIELDAVGPNTVDGRHIRAITFQEVRLAYLDGLLASRPPGDALVIGSGRGLLARAVARRGWNVTAADPSAKATETARGSEDQPESPVAYVTATPADLAVSGEAYDLVYVADTFEVSADLDAVVASVAKLLRPHGLVAYDTVSRTRIARLIYLGAFQSFPPTRIMPPGRYAAERLRPPAEVIEALARHGLRNEDICGFKPVNPVTLVTATLARRRGTVDDAEVARRVRFTLTPGSTPQVTYFGHAQKS